MKKLRPFLFAIVSIFLISCSSESEMKIFENDDVHFSYKKSNFRPFGNKLYRWKRDTVIVNYGSLAETLNSLSLSFDHGKLKKEITVNSNEEYHLKIYFKNHELTDEERFSAIVDIFQKENLIELN